MTYTDEQFKALVEVVEDLKTRLKKLENLSDYIIIGRATLQKETEGTPFNLVSTPKQQILDANTAPITNCKDVADGMKNLKVHGLITQNIEREVNTRRGTTKILDVNLDDKTAVMRITFWNPGKVPALKNGEEVTIEGLLGKPPYNGSPQASGGDHVKVTLEKA